MTELFAGIILLMQALFWIAVWLAGALIVTFLIAAPIAFIASKFIAPPPD